MKIFNINVKLYSKNILQFYSLRTYSGPEVWGYSIIIDIFSLFWNLFGSRLGGEADGD